MLQTQVRRVFEANFGVYGVRKIWRQLAREGIAVARCTVARLMRQMGLQGVVRGKPAKTTVSDRATPCPADRVRRRFQAPRPNVLWVSDFTYVATWQGNARVAFVIDTFARRIVGWRASRTAHASFVLDALEQALHDRRPVQGGGLVHHSDRGVQYVSIRYTERLAEAGIEPSVGSVGDSYGRVEDRRGGCSLPVGLSASLSPAPAVRADMAPSPVPARQTGRADFPHPAFSRSIRPSLSAGRRVAVGCGRGRVSHTGTRPGSGGTRCLVVPCGASTSAGPGGQCSLG